MTCAAVLKYLSISQYTPVDLKQLEAGCAVQVTNDISNATYADVFSSVGKRTDVIVRFSVVTGPSGSPEWLRDPRGFAVKFYTNAGNWDLVGNNLPVRIP